MWKERWDDEALHATSSDFSEDYNVVDWTVVHICDKLIANISEKEIPILRMERSKLKDEEYENKLFELWKRYASVLYWCIEIPDKAVREKLVDTFLQKLLLQKDRPNPVIWNVPNANSNEVFEYPTIGLGVYDTEIDYNIRKEAWKERPWSKDLAELLEPIF